MKTKNKGKIKEASSRKVVEDGRVVDLIKKIVENGLKKLT